MATIPGTVGGFIYNNAGAYHKEIKDVLISVDYLDNEGNIKNIETKDLMFSYRSSIFKTKQIGIIIRGYFKINNQGDRSKIDYFYDLKKRTQPINEKNLGSVFKNNLLPSWKIIDKIGYRGKKINDIMVSLKHANFIINIGNATYKDTITLIKDIQNKSANIGYNLELEWEIIENFR